MTTTRFHWPPKFRPTCTVLKRSHARGDRRTLAIIVEQYKSENSK